MSPRLRRLHGMGGVLLGGYAVFHLYVQSAALDGRQAWLERMRHYRLGLVLGSLIVLSILGHAVLGGWRWLEHRKALRAGSAASDVQPTFQLVTGGLLAVFVVCHLVQVWPPASGPHASLWSGYETLWATLGQPAVLVTYVVGVTALAFHFAAGLIRLARLAGAGTAPPRVLRYAAGVLGVVLWVSYLQVVARFAIGEAMLPFGNHVTASEDDGARLEH